jgi:hypothetical protein
MTREEREAFLEWWRTVRLPELDRRYADAKAGSDRALLNLRRIAAGRRPLRDA